MQLVEKGWESSFLYGDGDALQFVWGGVYMGLDSYQILRICILLYVNYTSI